MTTIRRIGIAILCSASSFSLACEQGVKVTYYCPGQQEFVVTTRGDSAHVVVNSDTYHLASVTAHAGMLYSDGVRILSTAGPDAGLILSDSVAYNGCTSAPHP